MNPETMTELEKMDAGLEFRVLDPEVDVRKKRAAAQCARLRALDPNDYEGHLAIVRELFGSVGEVANVLPGFNCDNGKNIHVGEDFLANYNVTILDIAPVRIGRSCMIGPNKLITSVGHPLPPAGRRRSRDTAKFAFYSNNRSCKRGKLLLDDRRGHHAKRICEPIEQASARPDLGNSHVADAGKRPDLHVVHLQRSADERLRLYRFGHSVGVFAVHADELHGELPRRLAAAAHAASLRRC